MLYNTFLRMELDVPEKQQLPDDLIDLDKAARMTKLRSRTISLYVYQRRIPSVLDGRSRRFSRSDLRGWLRGRRQKQRMRRKSVRASVAAG